jgi:hypothetical protein
MSYSRGDFVRILDSSSTNLPRHARKIVQRCEDAGPKTCYGQGLTSNPVGKLIPMETAMHDINGALNLLKAGHSIQRPGSNMKGTSYFLKNENGKEWLYVRQLIHPRSSRSLRHSIGTTLLRPGKWWRPHPTSRSCRLSCSIPRPFLGGTKGIRWDYDILQLPRKSPIAFHWCAVLTGGELALRSMLFGVKA